MIAALLLAATTANYDTIWSSAVEQGFYGGAIVTDSRHIIFEKSTYTKNDPFRVTGDTEIPICSVTKLMTAQMIMILAQEKKLKLDDPVGKVLRWLPAFAQPITSRQLLTHTSGLRNMDDTMGVAADGTASIYLTADPKFKNHEVLVKEVIGEKITHDPGSNYDYNNTDFLVLAAVAEAVSGKSFDKLIKQMIFEPAGMKETRCASWGEKPGRYVASFDASSGKPFTENRFNFGIYPGAGNVISTPNDVAKWVQWELQQPDPYSVLETGSAFGGFQGFGCYAYDRKIFSAPEPVVERPGAIANYIWQISFLPNRKVAVITYSNRGGIKLGSVFEGGGLTFDLLKATATE